MNNVINTSIFAKGVVLRASLAAGVLLSMSASQDAAAKPHHTDYCFDVVFRETPYADIACASHTRAEYIGEAKHFELDYDDAGRLIEVRYVQKNNLRNYAGRFVRAPKTRISFKDGAETRIYFNEYGHRTVVSGDVYETRIDLAPNGDRRSLTFFDVDGAPTENDFAIAKYSWVTEPDGDVIEKRYRLDGSLQRNRPGFGYFVTRFSYDARGLLRRMTNLGEAGETATEDDAGIVATQIQYDRNNRFTRWTNLAHDDAPKRGMSGIAEIRYEPSRFAGEQIAYFIDADGSPQKTRWGAHIVDYEFDDYGNETLRRFLGVNNDPINANNGVGRIVSQWTEDGAYLKSRFYFDKDGAPAGVSDANIHERRTEFDTAGRPSKSVFYSLSGDIVIDPDLGYAVEETIFDDEGHVIELRFLDPDGALSNHAVWGVARFTYEYDKDDALRSIQSYTAASDATAPTWNPRH